MSARHAVLASTKRIAKRVVTPMFEWSGIADRKLEQLLGVENRLLILMYHRVIDDPAMDPFDLGMCVDRRQFEAQIQWLSRHFHPLDLTDAVTRSTRGERLPPRSLAITFDDGYRDNLQWAAPILARFNMPATFYVVTGGIDTGQPLWWDEAIAVIARARAPQIDADALGLPGLHGRLSLSALRRTGSLQAVLTTLWQLPPPAIAAALRQLRAQLKPADDPRLAADRMTSAEVARLASLGFTIGGHTAHHADPATCDALQMLDELRQSRRQLESITQRAVSSFAYPDGRMSNRMPSLVREAGFEHAVSTIRAINEAPLDRYALARVGMPNASVSDFKRAICNLSLRADSPEGYRI